MSEQERVRREKLDRLQADGVPGYPVSVPRTHSSMAVIALRSSRE